jgi:ketosteroid isomerase-like protein
MKKLLFIMASAFLFGCTQPKTEEVVETPAPKEPEAVEIADMSLAESCKAGLAAMSSGDIDAFVSGLADNAMYRFNNGDSISGKEAISKYWKERRANVIDEISFSEEIWLAVNVNKPQPGVLPGKWVFGWFKVTATYKKGKTMTQWMHTDYHFNDSGKTDLVIQYMDRLSIMQAMPK